MSTRLATAEWADPAEVEHKYAYSDGGVWLGRSPTDKQETLGYGDDRHVCVVSGSRGGKGTTAIVNNLCLWPGSVVVVDPKGENATVTARHRGTGSSSFDGLGQAVHVLDPFRAAQVDEDLRSRFNPLDALDAAHEETIDEAGRIADAIVVVNPGSNDPFWDESARSMVKSLLLHVLTAPQYEGRRNLITVRKLIARGDWEAIETLREAGDEDLPPAQGMLWLAVQANPAFDGLVAGLGDTFSNMFVNSPKQFESVLQIANRNTEFVDSPAMQRCLEASDFSLSDLKASPRGMSLYLSLPQRYMGTHYRWLRMMIALTVTEMEIVRKRPATGYPVLLLLDEFAGLKRMEVIENAVAQIAGFGVKLFLVLQSLEQLKGTYKENWETFLANSGLKVFFNIEDHFSREYVSKLIGETEVIRQVHSTSESLSESEGRSESVSHSRSESKGRSSSHGTSVSEGTNRSVSNSESRGISRTSGRTFGGSFGSSWRPEGLFSTSRSYSKGSNWSQSDSQGTSQGWSRSESEGVSQSRSESQTEGTSHTQSSGVSESSGKTVGSSRARTSGESETIHRRALIAPDEIGQVFASVRDKEHDVYPGLALAVIAGEKAIALRRVNYYEDYEFIGCFDPHPDHASYAPHRLRIRREGLTPYIRCLPNLRIETLVKPGQVVSKGQALASVALGKTSGAYIRSPLAGKVESVDRQDEDGADVLFAILHYAYETADDPFAELRAWMEKTGDLMARTLRQWIIRAAVSGLAFVGAAALVGESQIFWGVLAASGAFLGVSIAKARTFRDARRGLVDLHGAARPDFMDSGPYVWTPQKAPAAKEHGDDARGKTPAEMMEAKTGGQGLPADPVIAAESSNVEAGQPATAQSLEARADAETLAPQESRKPKAAHQGNGKQSPAAAAPIPPPEPKPKPKPKPKPEPARETAHSIASATVKLHHAAETESLLDGETVRAAQEDKTRERLLAGALAAVLVMAFAALSLMRSPKPDTQTTTPQETAAAGVGNGDSASAENSATGTDGDAAALGIVPETLMREPMVRPWYRLYFFKGWETDSPPGLSQPHGNETYIQLFVGTQGEAEAYVKALRRRSYTAIAASLTGDAGLYRVLVGPVADGALDDLLSDLQMMGLPADPALVVKF